MLWRNTTWYESQFYPEEGFRVDQAGVRRRGFIVDSLFARRQAAADFCGFATVQFDNNGLGGSQRAWISRVTPHVYPAPVAPYELSTGGGSSPVFLQALYCTALERVKPIGITQAQLQTNVVAGTVDKIGIAERFAEIDLHYQTYQFFFLQDAQVPGSALSAAAGADNPLGIGPAKPDEGAALARGWIGSSRYVSRTRQTGGRTTILPSGCFKYVTEGVTGATLVGTRDIFSIQEAMTDWQYTWHFVPVQGYPSHAIAAAEGTVNGTVFDGHAIGTLLFLSASEETHTDALGQMCLTVRYHFRKLNRVRRGASVVFGMQPGTPLGWNASVRQLTGTYDFEYVSADGSMSLNQRPYQTTDFSRLFRPDQSYSNTYMT